MKKFDTAHRAGYTDLIGRSTEATAGTAKIDAIAKAATDVGTVSFVDDFQDFTAG